MTLPTSLKETIFASFCTMDDPRASNRAHPLETVLFSVIVGVLCGGDGFVQAARIAAAKEKLIRRYVPTPNGIPTHDTMARVLGILDPAQFCKAFATFISLLTGHTAEDVINIDGKTLRGAVSKKAIAAATAEDQVHMVSALSAVRGVVLAQLRSAKVANEVVAAQELIEMLDVEGAVVTMDAAHTVAKTLTLIASRGADLVVGVKANAARLFAGVEAAFQTSAESIEETEQGHGRIEYRKYEAVPASGISVEETFQTLRSFVRVTRQRIHPTGPISEPRLSYYASSIPPENLAKLAHCVRTRWAIENSLHYVLDVSFDEDNSRVRTKNAAENLSRIRHIVLSLLREDKTETVGLGTKRLVAGSDERYLARVLKLPKPRRR
jgi:predicted transposase YbfD/YdcC